MPERPRVLHAFAVSQLGGAELNARHYACRQPEFEHHFLFLIPGGPAIDYYGEAGFGVEALDLETDGWPETFRRFHAARQQLAPALVHAYGLRPSLMARLSRRRQPLVQAIHSVDAHRPVWQALLDRATAGRVDCFIANSQAGAQFVVSRRGVSSGQTAVVPNGIDTDAFRVGPEERRAARQALGLEGDERVILTIANLRRPKGLDVLLEVAVELGDRADWVWLIAGEGPERRWFESQVRARGLRERVRLLGFRHDTQNLLAACDVFCLTSRREGVPVAILEAMAASKAVAATHVGGIAELVADGVTGILVEPDNPGAMRQALVELLADEAKRGAMGAAARERAVREFGIERAATALADIYRRLMKRPGG